MSRQLASRVIKKVVNNNKLEGKINTHSFRKSYITKLYKMLDYNIAELRMYSRHKALNNLQYYISTTTVPTMVEQLAWM